MIFHKVDFGAEFETDWHTLDSQNSAEFPLRVNSCGDVCTIVSLPETDDGGGPLFGVVFVVADEIGASPDGNDVADVELGSSLNRSGIKGVVADESLGSITEETAFV